MARGQYAILTGELSPSDGVVTAAGTGHGPPGAAHHAHAPARVFNKPSEISSMFIISSGHTSVQPGKKMIS